MVQLEASERDVSGDNEAEVSRLPGASQSGATHPGTSVPGASHDRASVEDLLRELRNDDDVHENVIQLQLKEFNLGTLYSPSDEVFTVVQHVEQLFRSRTDYSLTECTNAVEQLEEEAMLLESSLPSCHDVKRKFIANMSV